MFLGMFPPAEYPSTPLPLDDESRILLYTDGLTEAINAASDEMFGLDRLAAFAGRERALAPPEFADALLDRVRHFTGQALPENDDVTVVVVDVTL
jgi:sigma-B regulation protein RsbU (phosphoserine phosphatase)